MSRITPAARRPLRRVFYRKWLAVPAGCFLVLAVLWAGIWATAPAEPLLEGVPFGTAILDSKGGLMRLGLAADDRYRLRIPLEEIAPDAVEATLEYEDRYFYHHPGVNPIALCRAFASLFGGRRLGASTITMQVARLRYGLRTTTLLGKLKQIWLALGIELTHSKAEILEAYFNLAPYGGNVEGISAASRIYFHKSASELTALESRALALTPQNPAARHPVTGGDLAAARARFQGGQKMPAAPLAVFSLEQLPFVAPHLALELERGNRGREVRTGVERDLQFMLERIISAYARKNGRFGLNNAAAILLRWTDMQVCALAGSASFQNQEISGQIDGTKAYRSPGSTLKPFIYALALEQGLIHTMTILADSPRSFGGYDPANFDRGFRGPLPAHESLKASRNLPAIYLAEQLRSPGLYGFLQNAGIRLPHGPEHYGLALALGGAELSMRDLAALYAMLANQGIWQIPLYSKNDAAQRRRLLSPEAAWLALDMLRRPESRVLSFGKRIDCLWKTGTSNGLRDAWTAGIIGQYVLVVWLGNFDNSPNPNLVGASAALPLFEEMARALALQRRLLPMLDRPEPELNLRQAQFCSSTGDLYQRQCADTVPGWIIPGVSPVRDSGILRKILVDLDTGLRSCPQAPGSKEEIWWEFWPSDLRDIFASAGIHKAAPPEWLPECGAEASGAQGRAPRIILPKKNVAYQKRLGDDQFAVPLQAAVESGTVHWYADAEYIGSARAGETIYWRAGAGRRVLRAVDEAGRSARQECTVLSLP